MLSFPSSSCQVAAGLLPVGWRVELYLLQPLSIEHPLSIPLMCVCSGFVDYITHPWIFQDGKSEQGDELQMYFQTENGQHVCKCG